MMKRILAAVLAAVMLGGIAVMPASAANDDANRTYDVYCEGCGAIHTWYAIAAAGDALTEGHYFLAFAGNSLTMARKTITKDVCLLLENKEWVGNRHIILKSGAVLNVQGPGILSGRGEDLDKHNNATYGDDGGAVRILEGAVCNLYGGTVTYAVNETRNIKYGGAVSVHGTFNVYSGEVKDGIAQVSGGTVYVGKTGVMNLYGGSITGGQIIDTTPADYCVYNSGKITLANDAVVEAAYLAPAEGGPALSEMITVAKGYCGSIALYLAPEVTLTDGLVLGKVEGQLEADITLPGTGYQVSQDGDKLIAKWPALVENTTTGAEYASLQEAFSQAVMGDTLRLNRDTDETVTLDRTVTLELSGNSIAGVSVAQDFTLYVRDSKTQDFSISDEDYGVIKAVSGDVQGAPVTEHTHAYMKYTDSEGTSFHAVGLDLTAVNLRPEAAGMYYTAMFTGDSAVLSQVESYGIAMSVTEAPTAENMEEDSKYTVSTEGFGTEAVNGGLLQNILRPENRERDNVRNAEIPVFGAAYVQLQGGERIVGEPFSLSLRELTEAVDAMWDALDYPQRDGIMNMYDKYSAVMDGWNIPNIKKALSEEDQVLRILSIGQSHSQDAIWLLQEVLQAERPDDQFYIAECIRSVTMVDHVQNAKTDNPIYTYYVNTSGAWVEENSAATIRQALKAQRWDMVIINESCRYLGLESTMKKGYVHEMAQFVHDQIGYDFQLMYNWHWTIPVSQVFYMEGFEPAASSGFWSNYQRDYQANREVHYNAMKAMVEKYIETDELIDGIFYTGTTIQYATEVLGMPEAELSGENTPKLHQQLTDRSMYRDYIHLSDYGRLFAAYQEYAQIYGLDHIEEVNVDVIEAHLRQWRWVPEGDVPLTQEMKDAIIESVNYTLQHPKEIIKE